MKRQSMIILGALALLFMAPAVVAYFFYQHPHWLPATSNRGQFVRSAQPLDVLGSQPRWQLILWHVDACAHDCAKSMDDLARVRLAMGRHARQIDTILLLPVGAPAIDVALAEQLATQGSQMLRVTNQSDEALLGEQSRVFIANPQHHLVLWYQWSQPLDDVFQDLKHMVNN